MATPSQDRDPYDAAREVFNTYELVEQILIDVPSNKTVLLALRLNKMANHVINRSLSLQRKLFLEPATLAQYQAIQPRDRHTKVETETGYAVNPLFVDKRGKHTHTIYGDAELCNAHCDARGEDEQLIKLVGVRNKFAVWFTTPITWAKYDVFYPWDGYGYPYT